MQPNETPRRVFVTGATGFIGAAVAKELVFRGHSVAVMHRAKSSLNRLTPILDRVELIEASAISPVGWAVSVRNWKPDILIHLAWDGVAGQLRNDPVQGENVQSAVLLVQLAQLVDCKAWVGLGSQAEYGPVNRQVAEDHPLDPTTEYGKSKVEACRLAADACQKAGLRFGWLRVFSTYGPDDGPHWMLPSLIERLLDRERPSLTPCEQLWDYLFVDDAARAIVDVALDESVGGIFNLGSGRAVPLREVVEQVRDLIDPSLPLGFGETPYRPDQVMLLQADISRLTAATRWTPSTSLLEGLRRTVDWHKRRRGQ
jgi:UDP-glucose 4-epimerase